MTIEKLIELDMAFCEATSRLKAQGWADFFLDNGTMLTKDGDNIVGESVIYERMKAFLDKKGSSLLWSPENGGISSAGDLGYTYGKYIRRYVNDVDATITETGRYLTIWRKLAEGKYKVEVDMGN